MAFFFPIFYVEGICKDNSTINNIFYSNGAQLNLNCLCITGNYGNLAFDGIACYRPDYSFFKNTSGTLFKFILKDLTIPSSAQNLTVDAFMRDEDLKYILGPKLILATQAPS